MGGECCPDGPHLLYVPASGLCLPARNLFVRAANLLECPPSSNGKAVAVLTAR